MISCTGNPRPKTSFSEQLRVIKDLYERKNRDYTYGSSDEFAGVRSSAQIMGVSIPMVILGRISDKVQRIGALGRGGVSPLVMDEKVEDSFRDIAVYAIMALVALENEGGLNEMVVEGSSPGRVLQLSESVDEDTMLEESSL